MDKLRRLLWIYLILLMFEGAVRKWFIPFLDAPLLLIRDPLVLWIYYEAWRSRLSFNNSFFIANLGLAFMTMLTATAFGIANVLVTVYGFRTDYMQIPLIFLMPQILHRDDVIAMGRFLLYAAIPVTALVVLQFRSPPDSLLNKGAMETHYGTVRPSGPFSFIAGLCYYFALVSSFVFYGYIQARTYKVWLLAMVTVSILLASACSGSRACLVTIALVAVVAILCVITSGKGGMGILVAAVLIGVAIPVLSSLSVVQEGVGQLNARIADASLTENGAGGFLDRYLSTILRPLSTLDQVPLFGYGLGLGTNAAGGLFQTDLDLVWPEDEWERLIFECGPIFGLLLCIFRVALALSVGWSAFLAYRRDNLLPMLIFGACGLLIFNGQWGVPTCLGFSIFGAGLVLAACEDPPVWDDEEYDEQEEQDNTDESPHSSSADTIG